MSRLIRGRSEVCRLLSWNGGGSGWVVEMCLWVCVSEFAGECVCVCVWVGGGDVPVGVCLSLCVSLFPCKC